MISSRIAALTFAALTGAIVLFQLALAAGAPWGRLAMGGAFPGALPAAMRVAALVQILLLAGMGWVVLVRAGLTRPRWAAQARWLVWIVVAFGAVEVVLNLITPSSLERNVWAPVSILLLLCAGRVALSRDA